MKFYPENLRTIKVECEEMEPETPTKSDVKEKNQSLRTESWGNANMRETSSGAPRP